MLGEIIAVTITAASLAPMERAYGDYLGYKVVSRGKVSPPLAQTWGTPKVDGNDYVLMQPESGAPHYFRFVVSAPYPEYRSMTTYGWNAAELLVKDPDALAAKLKDSPFQIAGPPRMLSGSTTTKAMQVIGPSNELLYLTNPSGSGRQANSSVDRFFIVINGAADLSQLSSFYRDKMGAKTGEPRPARVTVLNKALGLDVETQHPISVARLGDSPFSIEMDQFPKQIKQRTVRPGDLPPGISMLTFAVQDLDTVAEPFLSAPTAIKDAPYNGRRVAVIKGPSGELMELVETKK